MARLPSVADLFGDYPSVCDGNSTPSHPHGKVKPKAAAGRYDQLVKAMTAATHEGLSGGVMQIPTETGVPLIKSAKTYKREQDAQFNIMKSGDAAAHRLSEYLDGPSATQLAKEFTLTNPISTGLVPYDLEAPAKLLTPRPTPLRNSLPRVKGQGASRRFKVISGFTGTGTGGQTTTQPGINETTTNTGPGGLAYIRPPYINYVGYDVTLNYVSWGLSDSVSWQSELQGQGFEDVRSLSNTALLYSTMLLDERLILYGRGTTANNYTGALGTPGSVTLKAVSSSVAPTGPTTNTTALAASVFVVVAADAGDLLGTNGTSMHQGPATVATSVAVSAGQAVQVTVGTDVAGALGYNLYVASVIAGPYVYSGRTGYNVGYITAQPLSGPEVASGGADQSAVSNNFDGLLTNAAASSTFVSRINSAFSTTSPGSEFQNIFGGLYESVKGDPEEIVLNGWDRLQLSNAITSNAANSAYRVFVGNDNANMGHVTAGTVVSTIMNEVTGTAVDLTVHPFMPQGNALVRQRSLPIPDSNVSETSVMCLPQDYVCINWPAVQFTYDASTFQIGTLANYAPAWQGLLQGIIGTGIGTTPPSYGDA